MGWFSTLTGAGLGMAIGGPIGGIVGAAIGYGLGRSEDDAESENGQERIQTVFFSTVFATIGYVAKADGRVSEEEIRFVTSLMGELGLNSEEREFAKNLFREGKAPRFPLDDVLQQFRRECSDDPDMLNLFLWILLRVAYADDLMDTGERSVLGDIASRIGLDQSQIDKLEAEIRAKSHKDTGDSSLEEAYEVLGVRRDASDAEIRRTYTSRMKDFHPDKLESKGLPEEMKRFAEERCKEFSLAYETIRQARSV